RLVRRINALRLVVNVTLDRFLHSPERPQPSFRKCESWFLKQFQGKFYRAVAMKPPVHAVRDLGQTIKRLRLKREMTQQELAGASGLDIRYIGSIERGLRNPTFWSAARHRVCVWDEDAGRGLWLLPVRLINCTRTLTGLP